MTVLHLPPITPRVKEVDGKQLIFDPFRKQFVALTPEEWVRQHFVSYLHTHKSIPTGVIGNEVSLVYNRRKFRCDTVIYHRNNGTPLAIVEYKAPQVEITQETFEQLIGYNRALKANYLMVSNGINHYCCHIDYTSQTATYLFEIPSYEEMISDV